MGPAFFCILNACKERLVMSGGTHFHPYRETKPYRNHNGKPRIVIYIDEETYEEIDAMAKKSNCSLSEQARILIDVGIEEFKKEE